MISGCKEWDSPALKISALAERLLNRTELAYLRQSRLSWYRIQSLRRARRKIFRLYLGEIVREYHASHSVSRIRFYRSLVGIRLGLMLEACGFDVLLAKSLQTFNLAIDYRPKRHTGPWLVVR
jgi:hypothetical protein